jgi:uncharacterized protein YciI
MHRQLILLLSLAFFAVAGCSTAPRAADAEYVFVYLKTGPHNAEKTKEERETIQAGHLANIGRLADAGKLIIAGPFGTPNHDKNQRGIFVFDVRTVEEARALTETDPGVQSGVFAVEAHPLRASPVIRRTMQFENQFKAQAAREGKKTGLGDNIRGYVMVIAKDAHRADEALLDLDEQGKIVWSGHFGGDMSGQGVYVIDAPTVEEAEKMLGYVRGRMGECWIDSWWSSKSLEKLAALRGPVRDSRSDH